MDKDNFEYNILDAVMKAIHKQASSAEYIKLDYNQRKSLPNDFIIKAWNQVDWDQVLEDLKPELHKRICNAVIGNMETELKTDVKKLMAVEGFRERLRMEVYPKIMQILNKKAPSEDEA